MRRGSPQFSFSLAACASAALIGGVFLVGCRGKGDTPAGTRGSAKASAEPPTPPLTDLRIEGDGFSGTLRLTTSLAAPLVVFLPKTYGSRREFLPFVSRSEEVSLPAHTLVLEPPKLALVARPPGAAVLPEEAVAPLVVAVRAAIAAVDARVGGRPALVLVGSDFGCTLAALVAKEEPRVRALAMLSPGASLHGVDLYKPFASLGGRPVFVAGADHDPVAAEPLSALPAMARDRATKKLYPGMAHGAGTLASGSPAVRDDLAQWLLATVRDLTAPAPSEAGASAATPAPTAAPPAPKGTL